jgi:hypothetical protein
MHTASCGPVPKVPLMQQSAALLTKESTPSWEQRRHFQVARIAALRYSSVRSSTVHENVKIRVTGTDTVQFNWECRALRFPVHTDYLGACGVWTDIPAGTGSRHCMLEARRKGCQREFTVHVPYLASTMESILLLYCTVQAIA